jgi:hypothetical protein
VIGNSTLPGPPAHSTGRARDQWRGDGVSLLFVRS